MNYLFQVSPHRLISVWSVSVLSARESPLGIEYIYAQLWISLKLVHDLIDHSLLNFALYIYQKSHIKLLYPPISSPHPHKMTWTASLQPHRSSHHPSPQAPAPSPQKCTSSLRFHTVLPYWPLDRLLFDHLRAYLWFWPPFLLFRPVCWEFCLWWPSELAQLGQHRDCKCRRICGSFRGGQNRCLEYWGAGTCYILVRRLGLRSEEFQNQYWPAENRRQEVTYHLIRTSRSCKIKSW